MTGASQLSDNSRARFAALGLVPYRRALERQTEARELRLADAIPDEWLFLEHPLVITRGVRGGPEDLLVAPGEGAPPEVVEADRGGMTTMHNPGQLVLYPIVKLAAGPLGAGRFSRELVAFMRGWIREEFGVATEAPEGRPGIYHKGRKLMSIGISARGGVTMHGVALNMNNDLEDWRRIIPCGDPGARPVSMSAILGREVRPADQSASIMNFIKSYFAYNDISLSYIRDGSGRAGEGSGGRPAALVDPASGACAAGADTPGKGRPGR